MAALRYISIDGFHLVLGNAGEPSVCNACGHEFNAKAERLNDKMFEEYKEQRPYMICPYCGAILQKARVGDPGIYAVHQEGCNILW